MTTDKLLGFLSNCPLLEHIDILSCRHRNEQNLSISLPSLRTYTETTFGQVCPFTVLNVLSLPPFCSVTLRFQNGGIKWKPIKYSLISRVRVTWPR